MRSPFLETAVTALERGDLPAALSAASQACHADPGLAEPHYAYGQAWLAMSEPARAEQAFAAAISANRTGPTPGSITASRAIARARSRTPRRRCARRCAARAGPSRRRPPIWAPSCASTGEYEGGRDAAARDARARTRQRRRAAQPRRRPAAGGAARPRRWRCSTQVAPPADDLAAARHWRLQRALALLQLGRAARGADGARRVRRARADSAGDRAAVALAARAAGAGRGRPRGRARARRRGWRPRWAPWAPDAVPEHAIMARYDLAKFWSGRGRAGATRSRNGCEGHALLRQIQPFSRAEHARLHRRQHRGVLDARAFRRRPARGQRRSGAGVHRRHAALGHHALPSRSSARAPRGPRRRRAAGARPALRRSAAARRRRERGARIAALRRRDARRGGGDAISATLHALAPDKARIVDKMPGNYLYLGLVGLLLPGAKIIHCVRDPRDIGLSIFTFRFHGQHAYAHDLADLGWTIGEQDRLMAHWKAALPNPILTLRLADWVEDFDATLARVLDSSAICRRTRTARGSTRPTAGCARSAARRCASR